MRIAFEQRLTVVLLALVLVGHCAVTALFDTQSAVASARLAIVNETLPLTSDSVSHALEREMLQPLAFAKAQANSGFLREWLSDGEKDTEALALFLTEAKSRAKATTAFVVSAATHKYYSEQRPFEATEGTSSAWLNQFRDQPQVSAIVVNRSEATAAVASTMVDRARGDLGFTGVGVSLANLLALVDDYESRFHRKITFTDAKGEITFTGTHTSTEGQLNQRFGFGALTATILSTRATALTSSYRRDNSQVHVHSRFLPELNWFLIVEEDEAAAMGSIRKQLFQKIAAHAVALALAWLVLRFVFRRFEETLEHAASTDSLSGLANRAKFNILLEQARAVAQRNKTPLSLVLVDIDRFTEINDAVGELGGDAVIREAASVLLAGVRHSDVVSRWEGEAFVILLASCSLEKAASIAEQLRKKLEAHPFAVSGKSLQVTSSFAVAAIEASETPTGFFARLETALYAAKNQGRNRVALAESLASA